MKTPHEGGSYVRQKDGSLKRVVEAAEQAEAAAGEPGAAAESNTVQAPSARKVK